MNCYHTRNHFITNLNLYCSDCPMGHGGMPPHFKLGLHFGLTGVPLSKSPNKCLSPLASLYITGDTYKSSAALYYFSDILVLTE